MFDQHRVLFRFKKLGNLIHREMLKIAEDSGDNKTTRMHYWIINYIMKNHGGNITQKELEQHFNVRKPTISRILQLMEKNGLITRESLETDARAKRIFLTDKAKEVHETRHNEMMALEQKAIENISKEDLNVFCKTIDQMIENIS